MPEFINRYKAWLVGGGALLLAAVALFAWLVGNSSRSIGVIDGLVTEVAGEQIIIEAQREAQIGDPVNIYFEIPGFEDLGSVGSGSVTAVAGTRITAVIAERSGNVVVWQIAKIGQVPAGLMKSATAPSSSGDSAPSPAVKTPPVPAAVAYVGCYRDEPDFDLNGHVERSAQNTPQDCIATCQAKGFAYAGVQYGESCLCGNAYGRYGAADNCDYACTGDAQQICGGYNANSVYATGNPAPARQERCPDGMIGQLDQCEVRPGMP